MNLRRGLLRLWVVFSVAWIIAVGFHAYRLWPTPVGPWTVYQALEWSYPVIKEQDLPTKETQSGVMEVTPFLNKIVPERERWIVQSHLEWALGLPAAAIFIGTALWWAATGFRP
jgi:hypothetical protein